MPYRTSDPLLVRGGKERCTALQGVASFPQVSRFLLSGLPCVAECYVRGGISMVSSEVEIRGVNVPVLPDFLAVAIVVALPLHDASLAAKLLVSRNVVTTTQRSRQEALVKLTR